MKNNLLIVTFVLFAFSSCEKEDTNSCNTTIPPSGTYLGKVVNYYHNNYENIMWTWHFEYNNIGKLSSRSQEMNNGVIDAVSDYLYIDEKIKKIEYFKSSDEQQGYIDYGYNDNNIIKSTKYPENTSREYEYDNNRLTKYTTSDYKYINFEYDDNNNISIATEYVNDVKYKELFFKYDKRINPIYNNIPLHNAFEDYENDKYQYICPNNIVSLAVVLRNDTIGFHEYIYNYI